MSLYDCFSIWLLVNMAAAALLLERAHRKQVAATASMGLRHDGRVASPGQARDL